MTTVINNPQQPEGKTTVVTTGSSASGWIVAVIILVVVLVGGAYLWTHYNQLPVVQGPPSTPSQDSGSVNITVPTGGGNTNTSGSGY
jgi:cytoskeletal protein RodZ